MFSQLPRCIYISEKSCNIKPFSPDLEQLEFNLYLLIFTVRANENIFSKIVKIYLVVILLIIVLSDSLSPHGLQLLPGSSVCGISQARILKWVAISCHFHCHCLPSGGLPKPGTEPRSPALAGRFFIIESPGKMYLT